MCMHAKWGVPAPVGTRVIDPLDIYSFQDASIAVADSILGHLHKHKES